MDWKQVKTNLDDVQVRPADPGGLHLDEDVRGPLHLRDGDPRQGQPLLHRVEPQGLHVSSLFLWLGSYVQCCTTVVRYTHKSQQLGLENSYY